MNKHWFFLFIILVCLIGLTACGSKATSNPTPSPEPTSTQLPTVTFTPQPTTTFTLQPTVTPTPTVIPTLALMERQSVDAGGYSFQIPYGFEIQIRNSQATIYNEDNTILISMAITPQKNDSQTTESELTRFLANVNKDIKDFKSEKPYNIKYGEIDGLATNVKGTLFEAKNTGQILVSATDKPEFFIAFAFVVDGKNGNRWESEGSQVFETIINSIEFFEPVISSTTGLCVISSDPGYGYTQENPIKVGGDAFGGPSRERAYLDNLAGPNGEKLSYERTGSESFGDTILDIFVITGLSKNVILYIDEYSFTEPQAPVGFTCLSAFSLTKP